MIIDDEIEMYEVTKISDDGVPTWRVARTIEGKQVITDVRANSAEEARVAVLFGSDMPELPADLAADLGSNIPPDPNASKMVH
jgi:hypothetical protein